MEILRAVGRFIVTQLAILGFLLLAPVIFVGVSLFVVAGGAGENPGGLAFLYMAAGPFVSAAWTCVVCQVRRVMRETTFGDRLSYTWTLGGQLAGFGWMLYGFFGTLVAEVVFVFLFHGVSRSPVAFFAVAPFVVFSPLLLSWMWSSFTKNPWRN
jgi:hypothetical protein